MNIWKELLFLTGDLGIGEVKAFAAEELALEAARQAAHARQQALSAEHRHGLDLARRRAANIAHDLQRCA